MGEGCFLFVRLELGVTRRDVRARHLSAARAQSGPCGSPYAPTTMHAFRTTPRTSPSAFFPRGLVEIPSRDRDRLPTTRHQNMLIRLPSIHVVNALPEYDFEQAENLKAPIFFPHSPRRDESIDPGRRWEGADEERT